MSKFYVGQKVLVTGSSYFPTEVTKSLIGKVLEIRTVYEDLIVVYDEAKSRKWGFNPSDLQPIAETPETLTINGVEYIRKPEPVVEHEWEFGDVAVRDGKEYFFIRTYGESDFTSSGLNPSHFKVIDLESLNVKSIPMIGTKFIRRADLSV